MWSKNLKILKFYKFYFIKCLFYQVLERICCWSSKLCSGCMPFNFCEIIFLLHLILLSGRNRLGKKCYVICFELRKSWANKHYTGSKKKTQMPIRQFLTFRCQNQCHCFDDTSLRLPPSSNNFICCVYIVDCMLCTQFVIQKQRILIKERYCLTMKISMIYHQNISTGQKTRYKIISQSEMF